MILESPIVLFCFWEKIRLSWLGKVSQISLCQHKVRFCVIQIFLFYFVFFLLIFEERLAKIHEKSPPSKKWRNSEIWELVLFVKHRCSTSVFFLVTVISFLLWKAMLFALKFSVTFKKHFLYRFQYFFGLINVKTQCSRTWIESFLPEAKVNSFDQKGLSHEITMNSRGDLLILQE